MLWFSRKVPSFELGVKTLFVEPGSPWENGYIERFNAKFRGELLTAEFSTNIRKPKSSSNRVERLLFLPFNKSNALQAFASAFLLVESANKLKGSLQEWMGVEPTAARNATRHRF